MRWAVVVVLLVALGVGCLAGSEERPADATATKETGSLEDPPPAREATLETWPSGSPLLLTTFAAPDAAEITLEGEISASWRGAPARNVSGPVSETNWSQAPQIETLVFALWSGEADERRLQRVRTMTCGLPHASTATLTVDSPVISHREERFVGSNLGGGGDCTLRRGEAGLRLPAEDGPYHLLVLATNATGRLNGTSVDYTFTADAPVFVSTLHGGQYHIREDTTFNRTAGMTGEMRGPVSGDARVGLEGSIEVSTEGRTLLVFYPVIGEIHEAHASYTPPDHRTISLVSTGATVRGLPGQGSAAYLPTAGLGPAGSWSATTHHLSCAGRSTSCAGLFLLAELTSMTPLD